MDKSPCSSIGRAFDCRGINRSYRTAPRSIRGGENHFGVFISHPSKIKEMNNYINKKEKKQNEVIVSDSFKN